MRGVTLAPEAERAQLPPCENHDTCVKCRREKMRTFWHDGIKGGCPCMRYRETGQDGSGVPALVDLIGEHLCRRCGNCDYGYCTRTAGQRGRG